MSAAATPSTAAPPAPTLQRTLTWRDAFWVASGVPAYVLFSVGAIAATVGQPSWLVWVLSVLMGFVQSFTYAEIAGLFPDKSGGAALYGASAWLRYGKPIAPMIIWCYWFAWAPVLALASGLASNYLLSLVLPADSAVRTWSLTIMNLDFIDPGLRLRINAPALIAAALLAISVLLQRRGAAIAARLQTVLGIVALLPLVIISLVPLATGAVHASNLLPLLPLAHDAAGQPQMGTWNAAGWTLMLGSMFIAGYSTYGFETAVCYTAEFKDPRRDCVRAILYAGLLCVAVYSLVPLAFQGAIGLKGLLAPDIYDGSGVALAMANMVGGSAWFARVIVVMLILTFMLAVTTAIMGSARALYQSAIDGWLPRYLAHISPRGVPTPALVTTLAFNMLLLMMSDTVMVVALANVGYILFNFLNLQSGWIHRLDRRDQERPFRCPTPLLVAGAAFGFANLAFMGVGADLWGRHTLRNGLLFAAVVLPIFAYRHYFQDRGHFPAGVQAEIDSAGQERRAGVWPYVALAVGAAVIWIAHSLARLPAS
jgi:amino acid transporter